MKMTDQIERDFIEAEIAGHRTGLADGSGARAIGAASDLIGGLAIAVLAVLVMVCLHH